MIPFGAVFQASELPGDSAVGGRMSQMIKIKVPSSLNRFCPWGVAVVPFMGLSGEGVST